MCTVIKSLNIAESRSLVWRRMKKKSTERLPPDEDTLRGHIQHCNYVIFMNLHYKSPCAIESSSYHGWISQDGVCSKQYQKPAPPPSITVIRKSHVTNNSKRRRWNYNSRAWHNQRIWWREHIYWWRTLQMIMIIELHSFYFELTIFQDSLFGNYILFLYSYSYTFILQTLCFYSDLFISLSTLSCLLYHAFFFCNTDDHILQTNN